MILNIAAYGSVAALLAAVVACLLRRWRVAANVSGIAVISGFLTLLASVTAPILSLATGGPSAKAAVLSLGLSEAANCGAIAFAVTLIGALLLAISRRRLRAASRRDT